jgi:hypothetical protein
MAAIVSSQNAKAAWPQGLPGGRAKARDMTQRAMAHAAATVLIGAIGAALAQLAAEILSLPAPIAITAITLIAATLRHPLRWRLRPQPGHWHGLAETRAASTGKPARI